MMSLFSVIWTRRSTCLLIRRIGRESTSTRWSTPIDINRITMMHRWSDTEAGRLSSTKTWAEESWRCSCRHYSCLTADRTDVLFLNWWPAVSLTSVLYPKTNRTGQTEMNPAQLDSHWLRWPSQTIPLVKTWRLRLSPSSCPLLLLLSSLPSLSVSWWNVELSGNGWDPSEEGGSRKRKQTVLNWKIWDLHQKKMTRIRMVLLQTAWSVTSTSISTSDGPVLSLYTTLTVLRT